MNRRLRRAVFHLMKRVGGFAMSRRLTRHGLRILAYHGVTTDDKSRFQGMLFMSAETFRARAQWLVREGYPVLALDEAVERLGAGTLPPCATVLTFDDGWCGTDEHGLRTLHELGLPATLYVATYYAEKQTSVFDVALRYLFWRSDVATIDLSAIDDGLTGVFSLAVEGEREAAMEALCGHANGLLDAPGRERLLGRVGDALGVDPGEWVRTRKFGFMNRQELENLGALGCDLQLHTHRHTISADDPAVAEREIEDNRAALQRLGVAARATHLCYPSGVYGEAIWGALERQGIRSATTCLSGFNYSGTHRFELRRFLDSEIYAPIEFEAEMCGALELMRRLRRIVRGGS